MVERLESIVLRKFGVRIRHPIARYRATQAPKDFAGLLRYFDLLVSIGCAGYGSAGRPRDTAP